MARRGCRSPAKVIGRFARPGIWICSIRGNMKPSSKNSLSNSLGEAEETKVWLDFARDCGYLSAQDHQRRTIGYDRVSAMRWTLMTRWETFS